MNHFINLLVAEGFVRTNEPLTDQLVVHSVAGSGKSTLIRKFLEEQPLARAYTHCRADPPNLEGRFIQPFKGPCPDHFNILDEYCKEPISAKFQVLIADPLQYRTQHLRPHYVNHKSHRLGPETCKLLSSLGIKVESHRRDRDVVTLSGIFGSPILGQAIALDRSASDLLRAHGIQALCPIESIGQEYPVVTVVSSEPLRNVRFKDQVYIALSRHTEQLHVLSPEFPHTTSRPQ
ncbi:triple gene block protein 1 [Papaya mosaic virus]|uniref:Movement and silencing protein TGBp1 n=2 Tax=Papaya mosaic potexvirus TaxID=12181 RepID=TGB1_PMV|nr:triple gene block protein 1 [Papaya mosaic virus]P20952.1 RecName: Full=Movement and silencing protein TGBp1; AltName: Full=25 kDa protein; AltName: Full=Silencing suppressor P25; AltName: Full=Triple gene block 1 protein; Short=TGBp1 [Papaya mosaic virus]AFV46462.1 triple gene block protein 1 [Papaya mosaic virus]BAA03051.1 ORF2 (26K protein) [Papaya mosaic virus]